METSREETRELIRRDNEELRRRVAKATYLSCLAVSVVTLVVVLLLPIRGYSPMYSLRDVGLVAGIFASAAAACLAAGYFLPSWAIAKEHVAMNRAMAILLAYLFRAAFFTCVVVFGLVLALLGPWSIVLPFVISGTLALAVTFPTEHRWSAYALRQGLEAEPRR